RIQQNLTIIECAKATKITETSLSNIERGKQSPSLPTLRKLSNALDVSVYYLGHFESLPEKTLGQQIEKARKYYGFTKHEMAKRIGVDVKTLRGWEADDQKPLSKHMQILDRFFRML